MNAGRIILVLGGARSGKSAFAEDLVDGSGLKKVYLASAQVFDGEMEKRVDLHRSRRGEDWQLVEEPVALSAALERTASNEHAILVDCLTLWVTNLMMAEMDIASLGDALAEQLAHLKGTVVLVSNEVGQGIVPDNKMAREFRDHAGLLHQKIAAIADEVYFVTAGLPQKLKG
ncbi:MAG: bifunctional adenosylcobinamide kinase/adenosylcobinamide-phosphate guanylyltransferase [Rhizobiaceae bacterium]